MCVLYCTLGKISLVSSVCAVVGLLGISVVIWQISQRETSPWLGSPQDQPNLSSPRKQVVPMSKVTCCWNARSRGAVWFPMLPRPLAIHPLIWFHCASYDLMFDRL